MRLVTRDCLVAAHDVAFLIEVTPDFGGRRAPWELAWATRRHGLAFLVIIDDLSNLFFGFAKSYLLHVHLNMNFAQMIVILHLHLNVGFA